MIRKLVTVLLLFWVQGVALAQIPNHEAQMLEIASELRCLVCQNESIAASRADLAVDLRQQIIELLQQGKSADQVRSYMVERYGDFILYRTPIKNSTLALWFGPIALLLIGLAIYVLTLRKRRHETERYLSDAERKQADALLNRKQE